MTNKLTKNQLQNEVYYEKLSGLFFRINKRGKNTDFPCGSVNRFGYVSVSVKGRNYPAHKLAILYCYGFLPKKVVDHIDGDRTNNKITNLRACSYSVNSRNARLRKDNKTGVSGAYELPYGFSLVIGGVFIGIFKELEKLKSAAETYRKANGYGDSHGKNRELSIDAMISSYKELILKYKTGEIVYPGNLSVIRSIRGIL